MKRITGHSIIKLALYLIGIIGAFLAISSIYLILNPSEIGEFFGEIINGFKTTQ